MVTVLVLVSQEKPDEVWVTFVLTAESLENFDLSLVFSSLLSMERFDSKIWVIGVLLTSNNVSHTVTSHNYSSLGDQSRTG